MNLRKEFFKEAYRVVRSEGLYFFADYSSNDGQWKLRLRIRPDYNIFLDDEETYTNELEKAGFAVLECEFIRFNATVNVGHYVKSEEELERTKDYDMDAYEYLLHLKDNTEIEREFILLTAKRL